MLASEQDRRLDRQAWSCKGRTWSGIGDQGRLESRSSAFDRIAGKLVRVASNGPGLAGRVHLAFGAHHGRPPGLAMPYERSRGVSGVATVCSHDAYDYSGLYGQGFLAA